MKMTIRLLSLSLILVVSAEYATSLAFGQSHQVPVTIERRGGSPIDIFLSEAKTEALALPSVEGRVPTQLRITLVSKNLSSQNVTAYAYLIKVWRRGSAENSEQVAIDLSQGARKFLPGSEQTDSIPALDPTDADMVSISVDWVEFENGSTWGPDTMKASVRLTGYRAGMNAERTRLLRLLEQGGREELEHELSILEVDAKSRRGGNDRLTDEAIYRTWFNRGVQGFHSRVKHIFSAEGIDSVIAVLSEVSNQK
jgi:hypothetical protein